MRRPVVWMSGLSSTMTSRARPTTGTDVPTRLLGSRRRVSRSSGLELGMRRGTPASGTGSPVPAVTLFLLCLLSDRRRGEGLGIPSPLPGCHLWQDYVLVCCSFGGDSGFIYSDMLKNSCGIVSLLLVLLDMMHLVLCFLRLSISVAFPQVQFLDKVLCPSLLRMVPMARQRTFHRCSSWTCSFKFPVVVQRPIPMVFCSEDHKCSPVAPQHGNLCPCCTGRAVSLVSGSLCLVFGVRLWSTILRIFLGFRKYLRIQHSPVRQWIHVRRQSTRSYGSISHVFHVFDVPVVMQRQVRGQTVQVAVLVPLLRLKSLALLSWRSCRFSWSPTEIPQLLYIEKVVVVGGAGPAVFGGDSRSPTVAPFCMDTGVAHARRCATTGAASGGLHFTRAGCVSVATASCGVHLPCAGSVFSSSDTFWLHLTCAISASSDWSR